MALRRLVRCRGQSEALVSSIAAGTWLAQQRASFAKKPPGKEDRETDSKLQQLLKFLEPAEEVEIELSPEDQQEWQRRAKEYNRHCLKAHREWQQGLSTRLKLKRAALAALPEELRKAALEPPTEPFPLDRMMFTDTPPLPKEALAERDASKEQKQRRIGTKQGRAA